MSTLPRILRTQTGYRLNKLEATGLPPRASQALLLSADGHTAKSAAKVMQCSQKNVENLLNTLAHKTKTNRKTALITSAFAKGWLRFAAALFAIHVSVAQYTVNQTDEQTLRPTSRPGRRVRKYGELLDQENNETKHA